MVKFLLNKLWYALNAKKNAKGPSYSWKRERKGGDGLFFPPLQLLYLLESLPSLNGLLFFERKQMWFLNKLHYV